MPPELHFLTPIGIKSFVGWGFAPDSTGGAYSAPPDFLAIFRGPTSKERGDEGENKKGGKGREGKGELGREGKDRGGEGRRGSSYFALGRKKEVGDYDRNCE